jgi:hypothetical protein
MLVSEVTVETSHTCYKSCVKIQSANSITRRARLLTSNWRWTGPIAILGFLSLLLAQTGSSLRNNPAQEASERVEVASGEYRVFQGANQGGIGSYAPEVYNFRESWTIWRLSDGSFQVEGDRNYESPRGDEHSNPFWVHLAPDFRALGVKEFRRLRWKPDSGPLSCEFLPAKLMCTSGAKDPSQAVNLNMDMKSAYGFLWPISAFSLSSITRGASKTIGKLTPVQLVTVEEPSRANPVFVSVLDGNLKYLGAEEVSLAERKWRADKFELKVPLHPAFVIWTSEEGLLLGFAPESSKLSETGLKLIRYRQLASF